MTFNDITKDAALYTTTSRFVAWLAAFSQNVRTCGCPRMIFKTRPHGHRPRFCSSVTSTRNSLRNITVRRAVRCLRPRLMWGLVADSDPRTVSLSSRRMLPSSFRSSTASMRLPLCGERTLPTLLLLTSRHRIGSPCRSSACGSPLKFKQTFAVSRRAEQLCLRMKQRVVATVEESVLRTEMETFESQEKDAPKRVLWYTPISWLGQIRPHRRDEAWSASLWQTLFASCVGANIPALA